MDLAGGTSERYLINYYYYYYFSTDSPAEDYRDISNIIERESLFISVVSVVTQLDLTYYCCRRVVTVTDTMIIVKSSSGSKVY